MWYYFFMHTSRWRQVISALFLAAIGFALGIFGIAISTDTRVFSVLQNIGTNEQASHLANVCVDTKKTEAEIFFLSCGGVY